MKRPEPLLLALLLAVPGWTAESGESLDQVALRYVAASKALAAIKEKLGSDSTNAISLVDERRNVIVINSAHRNAASVRGFLAAFDYRSRGERASVTINEWLALETLGVRISLPAEWQPVQHITNFFIQKRVRHAEHAIDMSAGTFRFDISVEHYAGVIAASLTTNALEQLDHVAKRVHSDRSDLERIRSRAGGRLLEAIKPLAGFELIDVSFQDVIGGRQYDIRSKTSGGSGRTLYRRDFILPGPTPPQIVQVTYVGPSEEVFTNRAIINSVRKEILR